MLCSNNDLAWGLSSSWAPSSNSLSIGLTLGILAFAAWVLFLVFGPLGRGDDFHILWSICLLLGIAKPGEACLKTSLTSNLFSLSGCSEPGLSFAGLIVSGLNLATSTDFGLCIITPAVNLLW